MMLDLYFFGDWPLVWASLVLSSELLFFIVYVQSV